MKISKRLVAVVILVALMMSTIQQADAAYINPYGKYKAVGEWSGYILEYTVDESTGNDYVLIYYKGSKDMALVNTKLKKVKGKQNKYRTPETAHYLTLKVQKNKIIVKEIWKNTNINVHFMFEENAKLVFKKIKSY